MILSRCYYNFRFNEKGNGTIVNRSAFCIFSLVVIFISGCVSREDAQFPAGPDTIIYGCFADLQSQHYAERIDLDSYRVYQVLQGGAEDNEDSEFFDISVGVPVVVTGGPEGAVDGVVTEISRAEEDWLYLRAVFTSPTGERVIRSGGVPIRQSWAESDGGKCSGEERPIGAVLTGGKK